MDIVEIITSRAHGLGEKVYCVPNIPADKLKGAVEGIADSEIAPESVIAVQDITVFGACDDGLLFTDSAMYFKPFMEDRKLVRYEAVGSAEARGVVLKELVIRWRYGGEPTKIEATDFNASVAASILNAIAEARDEEGRRDTEGESSAGEESESNEPAKGKPEFEKARSRLMTHAFILGILGLVITCCGCVWWGPAAMIIAVELFLQYGKDAKLYDQGMPVAVYEADIKNTVSQAWFGALILIGVFGVPVAAKRPTKRIATIKGVLRGLKALAEERVVTLYNRAFEEKDDPQARKFVIGYLDWYVSSGAVLRLDLGGIRAIFDPKKLESALEKLDTLGRSSVRVHGSELTKAIADDIDDNDKIAQGLINLPDSGFESYAFADGSYYVHGTNGDHVRVCSSCGIAEIVEDESQQGEYFCSDFCRETNEECQKLVEKLRQEKFIEQGVNGAAFGGALHGILSSISENRRGVGHKLSPRINHKTNETVMVQTGHGVAAEKANTMIDKLMGRDAVAIGDDNALNGADRIVDGIKIQDKYYGSATNSVNAGFGKDGMYKYIDADNKPMQLEVPRDQYQKALEVMEQKIRDGKIDSDALNNIPGDTPDEKARYLVRKGHLTYQQSQNLCKCCTIESLAYDSYTGAIVGATAGGISFVLTTALSYYKTRDIKLSLRAAVGSGISTGGKAFAVYVLSAQLQRTEFVKAFLSNSVMDVNWGAHGKFVSHLGEGLSKMSGANNLKHFSGKANLAVKGAVVTAAATFAVTSAWEVGKMCCGKMSGMQCLKNIAVSGGGITAGTAGALFLGALMAPIPGGVFLGGLIGGAIGGFVGGAVTKAGMDQLIEDDSVLVMGIVSDEFKILAASFCLHDGEVATATHELDAMASQKSFVEDVYSKGKFRRHYVARLLRPIFIRITMARPVLFDKDVSLKAIEDSLTAA